METAKPENESSFRNTKRIGIIFLTYAVVLPFVILIVPESELPVDTGPSILSWLLIIMMPIEILLIYVFYRYFGKRFGLDNFQGLAVLMYVLAVALSIYAFVIGFTDSALRLVAIPLGLMFSLMGFWLTSMFLSSLWETFTSSNQ